MFEPDHNMRGLVELATAAGIPPHKIRRIVEETFRVELTAAEFSEAFDYQLQCGKEVTALKLFGQLLRTAMSETDVGGVRAAAIVLERLGVDSAASDAREREQAIESLSAKIARLAGPPIVAETGT